LDFPFFVGEARELVAYQSSNLSKHVGLIGGEKMNRPALFSTSLLAGLVAVTSFAFAQNPYRMSCSELWHQRNSIFKDAGYCFKTPRAIRAFGNAGCSYDSEYDLPLSQRDREFVNLLKRVERQKGC